MQIVVGNILLSAYYDLGVMPKTVHLTLKITLQFGIITPKFTNKEARYERGEVTSPTDRTCLWVKPGLHPQLSVGVDHSSDTKSQNSLYLWGAGYGIGRGAWQN